MAIPAKLIEHAVSNGVTLLAAWLLLQGTQTETEPKYVEQLQARIKVLEDRHDPLLAENFQLKMQKQELVSALGGNVYDIEKGVLESVVDNFGVPAWCKRVEEPEVPGELPQFVMEDLNDEYEDRYGIDEDAYRGKTDFDNHPQHVAQQYFANDMVIYAVRDYREFREAGDGAGGLYNTQEDFAKFWVPLPISGTNFVCGFLLNRVGQL